MEVELTRSDKEALQWAAEKADELYGAITGDVGAEHHHIDMMGKVKRALQKVGVEVTLRDY